MNLSEEINKHQLPVIRDGYLIKPLYSEVDMVIQEAVSINVRMEMRNVSVSSRVYDIQILVSSLEITGCVSCDIGASVIINAESNYPNTLVHITCQGLEVSMMIGTEHRDYHKEVRLRFIPYDSNEGSNLT